jgi:hypothetical protein
LLQVYYLNNPEKDSYYSHLPKHLSNLLSMFPGRIPPMALNLLTIIFIGDPLSQECIAMAGVAWEMNQK